MRLHNTDFSTDVYPLSIGYLASIIKKETQWQVLAYNADFIPRKNRKFKPVTLKYLIEQGARNYKSYLSDLSKPVWSEMRLTISDFHPSIVGIYCCSSNFDSVRNVARIVKEIDNNTLVIVGGPHATLVGEEVFSDSNIDLAVLGEGEETILEILGAVEKGSSFSSINGIIFRSKDSLVRTHARKSYENLDFLPSVHDYAPKVLKDYSDYPKTAFSNIMTTRGCNKQCIFCSSRMVFGPKTRFRSNDNVLKEIKYLTSQGIREIRFIDDNFGTDKTYAINLCKMLINNFPDLRWSCYTRADCVTDELLDIMKRAGCYNIAIGVESSDDEILKKMHKQISSSQIIQAATMIKRSGITLSAFYLIGFPDETKESLMKTFKCMKRLGGHIVYNIFTPYPGTEAFNLCVRNRLIKKDCNPTLYNHQSPENFFCKNMTKQEFREIASMIEKYVDNHNFINNIQQFQFRRHSLTAMNEIILRIANYGLTESIVRGLKIFRAYLVKY